MREGDAGDRFSIVERGALDVVRDGRTIARLGPGEGVGEIALLRNVPRTATVRAASPAVVAFLERDVFLEAVTGHPASLATAEEVIARRARSASR